MFQRGAGRGGRSLYSHHGNDFIRIAGALLSDIRTGELSEGATPSPAAYKNTQLTTKAWKRKARKPGCLAARKRAL
jgi:membrane peptidoglycan carboxypeptidase